MVSPTKPVCFFQWEECDHSLFDSGAANGELFGECDSVIDWDTLIYIAHIWKYIVTPTHNGNNTTLANGTCTQNVTHLSRVFRNKLGLVEAFFVRDAAGLKFVNFPMSFAWWIFPSFLVNVYQKFYDMACLTKAHQVSYVLPKCNCFCLLWFIPIYVLLRPPNNIETTDSTKRVTNHKSRFCFFGDCCIPISSHLNHLSNIVSSQFGFFNSGYNFGDLLKLLTILQTVSQHWISRNPIRIWDDHRSIWSC